MYIHIYQYSKGVSEHHISLGVMLRVLLSRKSCCYHSTATHKVGPISRNIPRKRAPPFGRALVLRFRAWPPEDAPARTGPVGLSSQKHAARLLQASPCPWLTERR